MRTRSGAMRLRRKFGSRRQQDLTYVVAIVNVYLRRNIYNLLLISICTTGLHMDRGVLWHVPIEQRVYCCRRSDRWLVQGITVHIQNKCYQKILALVRETPCELALMAHYVCNKYTILSMKQKSTHQMLIVKYLNKVVFFLTNVLMQ